MVCSHEDEDPSHLVPESIVKNAAEGIKKFLALYFIVTPRYSPTFMGPPTIFDVKSLRHLDRYLLLLIASLLQIFTLRGIESLFQIFNCLSLKAGFY